MRLIDADALKAFIRNKYFQCDMPEEWGNGVMWATSQINRYCTKVAPSIDIVFCKECKYFIDNLTEDDTDEVYGECCFDWDIKMPKADDFCSYGEHKESE